MRDKEEESEEQTDLEKEFTHATNNAHFSQGLHKQKRSY